MQESVDMVDIWTIHNYMRLNYMLHQLKRAGISQNDLAKIFVSIIRPVLEYACPVWSTSLPNYLSDAIEMIQKRVLRSRIILVYTMTICWY